MYKYLSIAIAAFYLAGCQVIPTIPKDSADYKIASTFEASKDVGVVYFYRDRTSSYSLHPVKLTINNGGFKE